MADTNSNIALNKSALEIINSLINKNNDLIFLFYRNELVLFNQATRTFFDVEDIKHFQKEFGDLASRFVPHELYFHTGKITNDQTWQEAILDLEESKRIVSMFNHNFKPHAFSVTVDNPLEEYEVLFFHDITTSLIKSLMHENNTNLDQSSGAYNKNYFEHIAPGLIDAATFNEKFIALCMIRLNTSDKESLYTLSENIKQQIRDDDMLVRWNDTNFVLACLLSSEDHALAVTKKVLQTSKEEQSSPKLQIVTTLKQDGESIKNAIKRCEMKLEESTVEYLVI
ncbi:MAG: hypothetical protein P8Y22_02145 [Sulfurimonas sp.]